MPDPDGQERNTPCRMVIDKENTQEKYAKICIVYKNNHGEVQNVWLNTFKGDVLSLIHI